MLGEIRIGTATELPSELYDHTSVVFSVWRS